MAINPVENGINKVVEVRLGSHGKKKVSKEEVTKEEEPK